MVSLYGFDRAFDNKTDEVVLCTCLLTLYVFLRFNTSIRQLQQEIGVTYEMIHRRTVCLI